jgi:hypothetical protein
MQQKAHLLSTDRPKRTARHSASRADDYARAEVSRSWMGFRELDQDEAINAARGEEHGTR